MGHEKKRYQTSSYFAATVGAATASVWILSGEQLPHGFIEDGIRILDTLSSSALDESMVQSFFRGGQDRIAQLGLSLAEHAIASGHVLCDAISEGLQSMERHLDGRSPPARKHGNDQALKMLDAGMNVIDALQGIVKAWGLFSFAKKAFEWCRDEAVLPGSQDATRAPGGSDETGGKFPLERHPSFDQAPSDENDCTREGADAPSSADQSEDGREVRV